MPRKVSMGPEREPLEVPDAVFGELQQKLQEYGAADDPALVGAVVRAMADPDYRDRLTYAALSGDAQFPAGLLRTFQDFGVGAPAPAAAPTPEVPTGQAQLSPAPTQGPALPDLATLLGMQPQGPAPAGMPQGQQPRRVANQNPASLRALLGPTLNRGR